MLRLLTVSFFCQIAVFHAKVKEVILDHSASLSEFQVDKEVIQSNGVPLEEFRPVTFSSSPLSQTSSESSSSVHPAWIFETEFLANWRAYVCSFVLILAGILCSAGGIGGGGIYVTVLMVAGGLSVHDAIPLSKSIVFFGSISSLVLNMKKTVASDSKDSLIDYNICRIVVPSSLIGTYLGVLLNSILPNSLILVCLTGLLTTMLWMASKNTYNQYCQEEERASLSRGHGGYSRSSSRRDEEEETSLLADPEHSERGEQSTSQTRREWKDSKSGGGLRNTLTRADILAAAGMLFIVIAGSVIRHHATACQKSTHSCQHPTMFWVSQQRLGDWMSSTSTAAFIKVFCFVGPLLTCVSVLSFSIKEVLSSGKDWTGQACIQYALMAVATGCLAGLVGIGGGLVFAPFFLLMGVEANVAVATSSTCVVFTSSSTTFQYLLTDRIIMSLTLLYGSVNLFASYLGTSLVHMLQDHFQARRSYISAIVLLGVAISTCLAMLKTYYVFTGQEAAGSALR